MKNVEKKNMEKLETYEGFLAAFLTCFGTLTLLNFIIDHDIPDYSIIMIGIGIFGLIVSKSIIVAVKIIHTSIKYWAHMTMMYVTYYLDEKDPNILNPKPDLIKTWNHLESVLEKVDESTSKSFDEFLKDYRKRKKIEKDIKENKK